MRNLNFIRKLPHTGSNDLPQSHIFALKCLHDRKPVFPLSQILINFENKKNVGKWANSTINISVDKPFRSRTIFIPHNVSFTWLTTEEGTKFNLTSKRGSIQILIPGWFTCVVTNRIINLSFTDPSLKAEFKTIGGAIYRAMLGITKGYSKKIENGWSGV